VSDRYWLISRALSGLPNHVWYQKRNVMRTTRIGTKRMSVLRGEPESKLEIRKSKFALRNVTPFGLEKSGVKSQNRNSKFESHCAQRHRLPQGYRVSQGRQARPSLHSKSTPDVRAILPLVRRMVIEREMVTMEEPCPDSNPAGLCAGCRHVRTIRSNRGSVFYLCRRSLMDPGYPQYPRLPVLFCRGYEAAGSDAGSKTNKTT
jgi:hypothetical protein